MTERHSPLHIASGCLSALTAQVVKKVLLAPSSNVHFLPSRDVPFSCWMKKHLRHERGIGSGGDSTDESARAITPRSRPKSLPQGAPAPPGRRPPLPLGATGQAALPRVQARGRGAEPSVAGLQLLGGVDSGPREAGRAMPVAEVKKVTSLPGRKRGHPYLRSE